MPTEDDLRKEDETIRRFMSAARDEERMGLRLDCNNAGLFSNRRNRGYDRLADKQRLAVRRGRR